MRELFAFLLLQFFLASTFGQSLEISRPARHWQFMHAVGPQAAILGKENGRFESWVYPLKVLSEFRLEFKEDGRAIPAEALARTVIAKPGSLTIIYSGDAFSVRETFVVPVDVQGAFVRLQIESSVPLEIEARFKRDFQLMWPSSLGGTYMQWDKELKAFVMGEEQKKFFALVGSPSALLKEREYSTNYSASGESVFDLGPIEKGKTQRIIVIAASFKSREELAGAYERLSMDYQSVEGETERFYEGYLDRTVKVELPDKLLQQAYDWSRLSLLKGLVANPFLGTGLVAGFGLSGSSARPGFAWFFGRDSCWSSFALTSAGDFQTAQAALRFISKFQRKDGKIPHEISQSASFVPWFENFPYGYASADATPLFIVAVRDYVQASGDITFAREQWKQLSLAFGFLRSTFDGAGWAQNLNVGHGWVEGGPLLPIRTEFYQSSLAIEAIRSMSKLAQWTGENDLARQLDAEFASKKELLNKTFWIPESKSFAFALDKEGRPVDQPSVLATVPMWFDLPDRDRAQQVIYQLADESFASDWGMRIISSRSPQYSPAGYHFGSVWPLFTGWASVGEYKYHEATPAFANLMANARLALECGGNTTEVLSGATYSPLSTSSSHQIWSAAMVVSPLLRGLFGLEVDVPNNWISFTPHLPAGWNSFRLRNLPLGSGTVDFSFKRDDSNFSLEVINHAADPIQMRFAPAIAPRAEIVGAQFNGTSVTWQIEDRGSDRHARFNLVLRKGNNYLTVRYKKSFGFSVPHSLPQLGESSRNLKIISETWSDSAKELQLTVSGRAGRAYRIDLFGSSRLSSVGGADLSTDRQFLEVTIPGSADSDYVKHQIQLKFKE